MRTLVYYVLGATADEQSRLQWDAAGALPESVLAADASAGFEFGLRLLIDGVQSAADQMLGPAVAVPPA